MITGPTTTWSMPSCPPSTLVVPKSRKSYTNVTRVFMVVWGDVSEVFSHGINSNDKPIVTWLARVYCKH
jgi:hypothetical protein